MRDASVRVRPASHSPHLPHGNPSVADVWEEPGEGVQMDHLRSSKSGY